MKYQVSPGQQYGSLTVQSILPGRKNQNRRVLCLCACGKSHAVNIDRLCKGLTKSCWSCSHVSPSPFEKQILASHNAYLQGARRRNLPFLLDLFQFRQLYEKPCSYCGLEPAKGVDRRHNEFGYIPNNCVPCCKQCNRAKRDLAEEDFLSWLRRISDFHREKK